MRLTDQAGVMIKVNAAFCRLVGKSKEALEGQPMAVIYPEERRAHVMQRHEERFGARKVEPHTERELTLWDGRKVWFEVSNSFFERRGQVPLLLGIFRDVTGRKQEQAQRLAMERKLQEAQRLESLGALAAGIAHDFNNLLTVILGNANLAVLDLPADAPQRPCLRNIEQASLRAADLCKQMLAFAGRGRLQPKRLDLNELLEQMGHALQVSIGPQAALRYELAAALPAVEGDATQMRQIVTSLVSNAAEALGESGGFVRVRTGVARVDRAYLERLEHFAELPEGEYVFVEVADNGCGISAEVRARIFEPFFTTKFLGRGLGLSAALGIARGHKGALKVESEPGRGSTFTLLLPRVEALSAEERGPALAAPSWRGSGTILVVDDEEAVRTVIARLLRGAGFDVLTVPGGYAAAEVLRAQTAPVRLILLDLTMPHLSGEAAYDEIRKVNQEAPIILMSGYTEAESVARFVGKPLAGFVQKPFKPDDLLGVMRAAIEKSAVG
jgi:PAS domain S-box-containing protein